MNRVAALLAKELEELRGNPALFFPAVITGLISIVIPFAIAIAVPYLTGEQLADSRDFQTTVAVYGSDAAAGGLDAEGTIQAAILQQFLILLIMAPIASSMAVAAYAVVGEKQARSLEPLLATPITTFELLAAKVLGAFVPALLLAAGSFALYLAGAATLARPGVYLTLLQPVSLLTMFLLGPLASLTALQLAICVSSRTNDARSAQQIGALVILPISGLLVAEFTGSVRLTPAVILEIVAGLAVLNAGLMAVGIALFDRESILTRWK